jgi:hypothetical protein
VEKLAKATFEPPVISALPARRLTQQLLDEILDLTKTAKDLFSKRHEVVHGFWAIDGTNPTRHFTQRSRWWQPTATPTAWTLQTLDELETKLRKLQGAAMRTAVAVSELELT